MGRTSKFSEQEMVTGVREVEAVSWSWRLTRRYRATRRARILELQAGSPPINRACQNRRRMAARARLVFSGHGEVDRTCRNHTPRCRSHAVPPSWRASTEASRRGCCRGAACAVHAFRDGV
jgi:hypothetical protein